MKRTSKELEKLETERFEINSFETKKLVKPGRLRAKEHRERKKKYIQELEHEIHTLRERVKTLEDQLHQKQPEDPIPVKTTHSVQEESKYEKLVLEKTGIDRILTDLKAEEKFYYEELPEIVKSSPDNIRQGMCFRSHDKVGEFGSLRVDLIKECFNTIIENILPISMKINVAVFNSVSLFYLNKRLATKNKSSVVSLDIDNSIPGQLYLSSIEKL